MSRSNNPLIQKNESLMPGVVEKLPSNGIFYEDTDILTEDVKNAEVVIYPMRLREELAMKAVDSIFQGTAVSETIRYCVPQVLHPERLVSEDVDFLLTVIKKITHGNDITYKDICFMLDDVPEDQREELIEQLAKKEIDDSARSDVYQIDDPSDSDSANEERRKLLLGEEENSEETTKKSKNNKTIIKEKDGKMEISSTTCEFFIPLDHFINNVKRLDEEDITSKYSFTFKNFNIKAKPVSFDEYRELSILRLKEDQNLDNNEYIDYIVQFSNQNILARLISVDDITDIDQISEWVDTLSLSDRSEMLKKLDQMTDWGIDFNYTVTCTKCGKSKETNQSYLNPLYFFLTS
jgi:hypothetical protein